MSLLRLVLVIGSAASFLVSLTPPAQEARNERLGVKQSFHEGVLVTLLKTIIIPKSICFTSALVETIATVSFYFPDEHVPSLIRSFRGVHPSGPPSVLFAILGISCMLGAILRVRCYRALGKFFTFNLSIRSSHALITTGPYAYVRHPGYTGIFMVFVPSVVVHLLPESWMQTSEMYAFPAVKVLLWVWMVYSAIGVVGCIGRIADEDKVLKQTFGKEWEKWAAGVKYRIIPGIY